MYGEADKFRIFAPRRLAHVKKIPLLLRKTKCARPLKK
jgi:hypothetical protein